MKHRIGRTVNWNMGPKYEMEHHIDEDVFVYEVGYIFDLLQLISIMPLLSHTKHLSIFFFRKKRELLRKVKKYGQQLNI